jgi:hypothetical protein
MRRLEEILESVGTSRREFVKGVIAGTTFAVPFVASFSMDSLSIGTPKALAANQTCTVSNQAGGECCQLATDVAGDIAQLAADTLAFTGFIPGTLGARLVDLATLANLLSTALSHVTKGVAKGGVDCVAKSKGQFKAAGKAMVKYQSGLLEFGLDTDFGAIAQQIVMDLDSLIPA